MPFPCLQFEIVAETSDLTEELMSLYIREVQHDRNVTQAIFIHYTVPGKVTNIELPFSLILLSFSDGKYQLSDRSSKLPLFTRTNYSQ